MVGESFITYHKPIFFNIHKNPEEQTYKLGEKYKTLSESTVQAVKDALSRTSQDHRNSGLTDAINADSFLVKTLNNSQRAGLATSLLNLRSGDGLSVRKLLFRSITMELE